MGSVVLIGALLLQSASEPSQVIDRLAAVVGGEPIFLSDVREAMRLQLLDPRGTLAPLSDVAGATEEEKALQRLINRRLVLAEVTRYSQLLPPEADIAAAEKTWRAGFADPPPHDPAVVRAFLVETLRIERYIDQRFTAAAQPTRDEARAFYKGTAPFESVEEDVRRQLAHDRRIGMVRDWLRGLRERAQVRILR